MASGASFLFDKPRIGLRWLVRLRWLAVAGQAITCLSTYFLLKVPLPLALLGGCIGVTLISNAFMEFFRERFRKRSTAICAMLLLLDTFTLTVMLYWTGGVQNPFATFYLLHLTIAAILLPALWTWIIVAVCAACQGVLFFSHHALDAGHVPGLWIAMVLTAIFIAFFVSKLSRELAEARRLAVRNERFESLATLAAGVAHELATPLGTIAVVSTDLGHSANPAETLADAKLIRSEVERCRGILEKLSDQATRGVGDAENPIRLAELPALIQPFLKPEHCPRIKWELESRRPLVFAPEAALLQSLAVLIKNACEASRPEEWVGLTITDDAKHVHFAVRDQGCGMPPEIATRIGEPFFTTKEPGVGMGLGVFLVRTFVERMRGKLDIQSTAGKGTVIRLSIPAESGFID